ncbi:hypothetical protein [Lactobacillus sp. Sy-1]|uniref:hypothetical protein n=1 Tax=Lactobacillus sp. Sy-1 TaxID=2109645 RepID=UPI001C5A8495|nr:hypothetical protein [Lactobacillus sp. Sy-1]MBW1606454.1 hypothetical protein [Lactobacillus sp. Sy-1]
MNSIKNFLKKSVLMAVATASLVTVAGVGNFSGNNVASVAHAAYNPNDPNQNGSNKGVDKSAQETLVNPNASVTTMPVYKTGSHFQNIDGKYRRATVKRVYLEGIAVDLNNDGTITLAGDTKHMIPKAWTQTTSGWNKHQVIALITNNVIWNYQHDTGKYKYNNKFINIKKFYRQVYHIKIEKLLTKSPVKNYTKKYANGISPSKYMVKGYKPFTYTTAMNNAKYAKTMLDRAHGVLLSNQSQHGDSPEF